VKKVFLGSLIAFSLCAIGCNGKELSGPCYTAMQYRQEAKKNHSEMEKAALLGKADALQRDCDAYNRRLQDMQNHNSMLKKH
jgi:hypothetical protein